MRYYYIGCVLILVFTFSWLFRKPLASHAATLFFRILAVVGTLTGVIAWTLFALGLWQARNFFNDWGDNAVTSSASIAWPWILLFWAIYFFPTIAFVLMFFSALNIFKGKMRCIANWYALAVLIIMAGFFWWIDSRFHFRLWSQAGFVFLGFAVFWAYFFGRNGSRDWEATTPQ